jgi:tetratricopeptide (TPR) repeat protein
MAIARDPADLSQEGKREFGIGNYASALDRFRQAAERYTALGDAANRAEQMNNVGVTLLQLGRPGEALAAVEGTEAEFATAGDSRRQGMAVNNQAAALEALSRPNEAIAAYERAAQILGQAGEGALQSEALKAAAAIDLRRLRLARSGASMLGALIANPNPNLLERLLKALLRHV